ncbi:replication protein RepA [Nocardia asteroides]|uniref:replication protein RepA n=1 Tax=Nocardia asteroides TaxID=1824 RepID=UPI0037C6EADE
MARPTRSDLDLVMAAAAIEESEPDIGYLASLFTQTSLPYRDPGDVPHWTRRSGALVLTVQPGITMDADGNARSLGYPYGTIPRLLLTWMSTEAVRTRSRELILGDSLAAFMRDLNMQSTGGRNGTISRFKQQMERLFMASLSVKFEGRADRQIGGRLSVASSYDLWWSGSGPDKQRSLMPSTVRLSQDFYDEVTTHPVPLDLNALRALRGSPMRLDIYAWLTRRFSYLQTPTTISWRTLQAQFGSNLADTPQGRRRFRIDFDRHLRQVLVVYSDADVSVSATGLTLKPSLTHIRMRGLRQLERR